MDGLRLEATSGCDQLPRDRGIEKEMGGLLARKDEWIEWEDRVEAESAGTSLSLLSRLSTFLCARA